MSDLTDEIIEEILARLPTKSLVCFNLVCKKWRSLISDPIFVRKHLNHVLLLDDDRSNNHHKLIVNSAPEFFSIDYDEESLNAITKRDFPLLYFRGLRILGSCNGLLLVGFRSKNYGFDALVLRNPLFRDYKILPERSSSSISGGYLRLVGFGYDSSIDDYKLVGVITNYGPGLPMCDVEQEVEIYTLKNNSWRRIEGIPYGNVYLDPGTKGTVVNGSVYWVVTYADFEDNEKDLENLILGFDLTDENFRLVGVPRDDDDIPPTPGNCLVEMRGCLGLYQTRYNFPEDDIWILKEDENKNGYWSRVMRISNHFGLYRWPLFFMKNDEVVLSVKNSAKSGTEDKKVVVYNPKKMMFRNLPTCKTSVWSESEETIYVETLVSPNGFGG